MSLPHFHAATALLIRLPDHHREGDFEKLRSRFDLDAAECNRLQALAADREVAKFGRKMRALRFHYLESALALSLQFIEFTSLLSLLEKRFDPLNTTADRNRLFSAYLNFFEHDPWAASLLESRGIGFLGDLIRFELTHCVLDSDGFVDRGPLGAESLLLTNAIHLSWLDHDLLTFAAAARNAPKDTVRKMAPSKRETPVLYVKDDLQPRGYRLYRIPSELYHFLEVELRSGARPQPLPASYADAVRLGLCKERP